jgi:hypothetical protein
MVRTLLIRGMLAGVLAGLLAFGFAKIFGEPQVDHAIAFEALLDRAKSHTDASPTDTSKLAPCAHRNEPKAGVPLVVSSLKL